MFFFVFQGNCVRSDCFWNTRFIKQKLSERCLFLKSMFKKYTPIKGNLFIEDYNSEIIRPSHKRSAYFEYFETNLYWKGTIYILFTRISCTIQDFGYNRWLGHIMFSIVKMPIPWICQKMCDLHNEFVNKSSSVLLGFENRFFKRCSVTKVYIAFQ